MLRRDELLHVVHGDLKYLREKWDESVDEDSLRISSPTLRRLLVDLELQRAWKAAGFEREPNIRASTLQPIMDKLPMGRLTAARAGGGHTRGLEMREGLIMMGYVMPEDEIKRVHAGGPPEAVFGLRAYVEAPCMVLHGHAVPRRVLLKYVANKLGGAHFDPKRGTTEEDRLYRLLDEARDTVRVADQCVVYFELLSAGQALANSEDVRRLQERIREMEGS